MAPGYFSRLWSSRQSHSRSDDGIVSPVLAPTGANLPSDAGVREATAVEVTRPRSPASSSNAHIPVSASTQGSLPSSTGPHSPEGNVDISVPAHVEEVPSASRSSRPSYHLDPAEAKKHIDRIGRFRVLVIGRANAGKTTILQRVCNTTDQPEIFNGRGEKLGATVVQGSLMRGHHNIEDELVFRSNPGFVFHDSCGFEAGSEEELHWMQKFVTDRAKTTKLDERIHAIWYCIPLNDGHRMVISHEKKFFDNCDTGHVPVIVLLTKADTLRFEAVDYLLDGELSEDNAMQKAAEVEREILHNCLERTKDFLNKARFPPYDYLPLSGMDQEGTPCTPLLTCTANSLQIEGLQQLLISTQQSNLEVCMEFAIMKTLKKCMNQLVHKIGPKILTVILSQWFPYTYFQKGGQDGIQDFLEKNAVDENLVPPIHHPRQSLKIPALSTSSVQNSMQYIAEHGIGAILVFEYLYFLLQIKKGRKDLQKYLSLAIKEYQTSGTQASVNNLIKAAFQEHGDNVEVLCPILLEIARQYQMSKSLNISGS